MKKKTNRRSSAAALSLCLLTAVAAIGSLAGRAVTVEASELFTERDLEQTADLSDAEYVTVSDGEEIRITEEDVYVLSGTAEDAVIYVEADEEAKVQLVLDGLNITNNDASCINVVSADKVIVTTAADSTLTVRGSFASDGNAGTDGVIFSKEDLVLNGTAALTVSSTETASSAKMIGGGTLRPS